MNKLILIAIIAISGITFCGCGGPMTPMPASMHQDININQDGPGSTPFPACEP